MRPLRAKRPAGCPRRPASGALLLPLLALAGCAAAGARHPAGLEVDRGADALAAGMPEDAADNYQLALTYRPDDPEALLGLARSRLARGEAEATLELLGRLERVSPGAQLGRARAEYAAALYHAASGRLVGGDPSAALDLLARLERVDREHPGLGPLLREARIAEAGRLQVMGEAQLAEAQLRLALGSERIEGDAVSALASSLIEIGRSDLAISMISDALSDRPHDGHLRALMDRALDIRYPDSPWRSDGAPRSPSEVVSGE